MGRMPTSRQGARCAASKSTDDSTAYKATVDRHATHILQRFGITGSCAARLVAVRRDTQRRESSVTTPVLNPGVFRARFLLLPRVDRLDAFQRARFDALFEAHPRRPAACEAVGELRGLYLTDDEATALEALDRFCDVYQACDPPQPYRIATTFIAILSEFLSWQATGRPSNGSIGGTIKLLEVLRRINHEFINPQDYTAPRPCRWHDQPNR